MRSATWREGLAGGLAAGLLAAAPAVAGEESIIPEDLSGYRFVNALVINDRENPLFGFHHFYVNEKGVEPLQEGGPYPEGTVFVGLVYKVVQDGKTLNEGEGAAIAVMKKVAGAEETAGWRFAQLDPSGTPMDIDPVKDCFTCHTQVKDRDYVFSQPLEIGERTNLEIGSASDD